MKVDFMIIGAQKCGTTTLFNTLVRHPSIAGCSNKEPHFFSTAEDWRRELPAYERLFPEPETEDTLYAEASTSYTFYPVRSKHIWDDLYEYNPQMKFIYIVRRPIDRVVSGYMHAYERGYTDRSIEEAIVAERSYIDFTRYYTQIAPYIRRFGRSQVHIIDFDDLVRDREQVLEELAGFLGLDPAGFDLANEVHANVSVGSDKRHHKYDEPSLYPRLLRRFAPALWRKKVDNADRRFDAKPLLSKDDQEMIVNMLELEVTAMEQLLDRDLSHWREVRT